MHAAIPDLISRVLDLPTNLIAYTVSRRLAEIFPEHAILETDSWAFDVDAFGEAGRCAVTVSPAVHAEIEISWNGPDEPVRTPERLVQGWRAIAWEGHLLELLSLEWKSGCVESRHWIVARSEAVARAFFDATCLFNHEIRGEVLVFASGYWQKSPELYRDIQGSSFESLVLAGDLAERVRRDFEQWISARALYEEHGVPWKRGVLFLGPPGNGKSHCIKALVKALALPCLYVRSFTAQGSTEHDCIRAVFERARKSSPCLLVLEDLDALVNDKNRSLFLNELDGFARNTGLLTVATTNHPERLDPAILERPSRFDRKYTFDPPALQERRRYLAMRNERLRPALRMDEGEIDRLTEITDELSFAYLQELLISSMVRWVSEGAGGRLADVALPQVTALRAQMSARPGEPPTPPPPAVEDLDVS
jgi:hypothetical protein